MDRIREEIEHDLPGGVSRAYTRRFLAWVLDVRPDCVPPSVLEALAAVQEVVDYTHPEEWYTSARMHRRKVYMHVGPTNSGKTHAALRSLAAARLGVYASPLRLLAHEVFDRLNQGKIVPLGADPNAPSETHKRLCNLRTGEEARIVSEEAGLVSCTIEMLSMRTRFDVAVVDEIQMLADPDRGGAWTNAVLGLNAAEIHLCGEEGAVPLVQSMLEGVGDELIVHRYGRLTPLSVEEESLKDDLKNIKKGDCVVTFSRSGIFNLKKRIEKETNMRCAVVYGRLPPEVRGEQAELFNNPDSGYDVLIGSDAIGMGLNLKIKRIVFESTSKFDGVKQTTLSLSQLKQIAGRAGRYGLLHESDSGGTVTTLKDVDLPIVRKAVEMRAIPVAKRAVLPMTLQMYRDLEQIVLPQGSFAAASDVQQHAARTRDCYTLRITSKDDEVVQTVDSMCEDYTLGERLHILVAPVAWRDEIVRTAAQRFLHMYRTDMCVDLHTACAGLGVLEARDEVQRARAAATGDGDASVPPDTLMKLESLYRIAVLYMWFNMRYPLVYGERTEAVSMKEECESAIEWCIEGVRVPRKLKLGQAQIRDRKALRDVVAPDIGEPAVMQTQTLGTT
ncbi:P-loop containing nucleoside triphosphate hydrolase protein [Phellopilus nigrolimitatus]|nr:P-loop containing nucleoside triphosphate hydrolase protein [Phellopilus nigrolimitatus]